MLVFSIENRDTSTVEYFVDSFELKNVTRFVDKHSINSFFRKSYYAVCQMD